MKAIELLEKYPLTTEVVRDWFITRMMESINEDSDVPEDFKKFMIDQGVPNDRLCVFIDANPRSLFDVFDEHNVYINIIRTTNSKVEWAWEIVSESFENAICNSRKEAELFAIEAAFEILENKLKPVLQDGESDVTITDNGDD